jgi:hypothetical protein
VQQASGCGLRESIVQFISYIEAFASEGAQRRAQEADIGLLSSLLRLRRTDEVEVTSFPLIKLITVGLRHGLSKATHPDSGSRAVNFAAGAGKTVLWYAPVLFSFHDTQFLSSTSSAIIEDVKNMRGASSSFIRKIGKNFMTCEFLLKKECFIVPLSS